MLYMLDTNIISYILSGDSTILGKTESILSQNEISIPDIVYYEIQRGLFYKDKKNLQIAFKNFCNFFPISYMTKESLQQAAIIYAELRKEGNIIEDDDILIGSLALTKNATLITNNVKHLGRIKNLKLEEWKTDNQ